jgi:hypothetical protein
MSPADMHKGEVAVHHLMELFSNLLSYRHNSTNISALIT